ncbi:MAG: hypothetical protein EOP83_10885 [Verrucomicrobiaceae bacterium]|nr:MAG: hypothetical protein EOP83_10885 [Verrucomicrobiaceae bacterium]
MAVVTAKLSSKLMRTPDFDALKQTSVFLRLLRNRIHVRMENRFYTTANVAAARAEIHKWLELNLTDLAYNDPNPSSIATVYFVRPADAFAFRLYFHDLDIQ